MYSFGIVICLLAVDTHEFSPPGEKQFGKLRDFPFFSGNSRKKTANFLENPQVQLPDKIIKNAAYYTILGLWKLNEVPFETYPVWEMYLMNMREKLRATKHIPL
jgi:hypothetical protein